MKNPRGLQADVLKVPHHGGSVFLESRGAEQEVLSTVRPKCIMISANGTYKLPHADLREAARRWGAAVFCTSRRQLEFVQTEIPAGGCCHEQYGCSKATSDFHLVLDKHGIRSPEPACASALGSDPGAIITIRHHVVEPSRIVAKLFHREMGKHVEWVRDQLVEIHDERKSKLSAGPVQSKANKREDVVLSPAITEEQAATLARKYSPPRLPVAIHIRQIFQEGMRTGKFWAAPTDRNRPAEWQAYALPSRDERNSIVLTLQQYSLLLFALPRAAPRLDRTTLLTSLDTSRLAEWTEERFAFPKAAFDDSVWPAVFSELMKWKVFAHPWGVLGLSQHTSRKVYQELLAARELRGDVSSLSRSSYSSGNARGIDFKSPATQARVLTCGDWRNVRSHIANVPYNVEADTPLPRIWFCSTGEKADLERYGVQTNDYSPFTDCACFSREDIDVTNIARILDSHIEQFGSPVKS
jgi:hypothetical protein